MERGGGGIAASSAASLCMEHTKVASGLTRMITPDNSLALVNRTGKQRLS